MAKNHFLALLVSPGRASDCLCIVGISRAAIGEGVHLYKGWNPTLFLPTHSAHHHHHHTIYCTIAWSSPSPWLYLCVWSVTAFSRPCVNPPMIQQGSIHWKDSTGCGIDSLNHGTAHPPGYETWQGWRAAKGKVKHNAGVSTTWCNSLIGRGEVLSDWLGITGTRKENKNQST